MVKVTLRERATSVPDAAPQIRRKIPHHAFQIVAPHFILKSRAGSPRQTRGISRIPGGPCLALARDGGAATMSASLTGSARRASSRTTAGLHELLQRIEGEYREMPGLSVTAPQAQRLWGLDSTTCSFVLGTLIERGVLKRRTNGTYVRG